MHVVHREVWRWCIQPRTALPIQRPSWRRQRVASAPAQPQAPTVSALCTPRTSSLSRRVPRVTHPPLSAGEPCLRAGGTWCACPSLQTQCGSPSWWSGAGPLGTLGVPPCGLIFVGITQTHQGGSGPITPHLLQGIPGFDPSPFPRCLGT